MAQFFALNGTELKQIILQRADAKIEEVQGLSFVVKAAMRDAFIKNLDRDTRFDYDKSYPQVKWTLTLTIQPNGFPAGTLTFTFSLEVEMYPGEPPRWDVQVTGSVRGGDPSVASVSTPPEAPKRPVAEDSSFVDGPVVRSREAVEGTAEVSRDDLKSNRIEPVTHRGDPIESGPGKEPWNPSMSTPDELRGMEQERLAAERHNARLEREMRATITLTDGDTITKPNAARRDAGLDVPKPGPTRVGQVVDRVLDGGQDQSF